MRWSRLSAWLASISPDTYATLHISRFFPRYHVLDKAATPVEKVYALADIARQHLNYVYRGQLLREKGVFKSD